MLLSMEKVLFLLTFSVFTVFKSPVLATGRSSAGEGSCWSPLLPAAVTQSTAALPAHYAAEADNTEGVLPSVPRDLKIKKDKPISFFFSLSF